MRYFIRFCGVLFFMLFVNFAAEAQWYIFDIRTSYNVCSAYCRTEAWINDFQFMNTDWDGRLLDATIIYDTDKPLAEYKIRVLPHCQACETIEKGELPNPYKGEVALLNGTLKYCYEPAMPAISVDDNTYNDAMLLKMPVWGTKYIWEVTDGSGSWQTFRTVGDGFAILESCELWVQPVEMARLFGGNAYGRNYYFRVRVIGCNERESETTAAATFKEPAPWVSLLGTTKATCYQGATGSATLSISNPIVNDFYINCTNTTTGQKFAVPDGSPGSLNTDLVHNGDYTIRGLRAGTWEFQVVNMATFAANTTLTDIAVEEPTQITVGFSAPPYNGYAIRCSGSTGDVTAIGNGGEGGYKDFVWSNSTGASTLSGVTAGTYTVKVRDKNDCQSAATPVTLSAPPPLSVSATSPKTYGGYEVRCYDQANGSATASVTGGPNGGYSYSWSSGASDAGITGLAPGKYDVTVTDANGCTAPGSVTLNAPPPIEFTIDQVQGLACKGDQVAMLEAKPLPTTIIGVAHYQWTSGEAVSTIRDKGAGTYAVTVSDDQGCSTTESLTLNDPPGYTVSLAPGLDYNGRQIKCNGDFNGRLVSTVKDAGGAVAAAQSYQWLKDGVVFSDGSSATQEGLGKGTYKVVITYGAQCNTETQYVLREPDPVSVTARATTSYHGQPISCYNAVDANVEAAVTGGTGTYSYLWNTGGVVSALTGIGAGTYSVVVKDINNCEGDGGITLLNPGKVSARITDVSNYSDFGVSCASSSDGSMTAVGTGGTQVFTYTWSNGRTTDVNDGLGGGRYTVTISDNNNCQAETSETITVPPLLHVDVASYKDVACYGGGDGEIFLKAYGGAGSYQYSRDNGASWTTDAVFKELPTGAYTLFVRDGNECGASAKQTLSQPTTPLSLTFKDAESAFCSDPRGGVTADVAGGTKEYTYSWTDGQGNVVGTAMRLSNARGGIYTVTIHDAHNCPITDKVGINSTDGATVGYTATAAKCFDSSDGSALLDIADGDGPFVIEWPDSQSTLEGKNLKRGIYIVQITDGNDCTVIKEVTVPAPPALALGIQSSTQPTCNGDCDGSLTLRADGGVGAYQYAWNGQIAVTQSGLCQGVYDVILTDGNGCPLEQPVTLIEPGILGVSMQASTPATCTDGCDGRLIVSGMGGNGGYAYSWDGGVTGSVRENLCPGEYGVMVTDAKGCVGSSIVALANTPLVSVDLGGGATLCVGQTYTLDVGSGWRAVTWGGTGLTGSASVVTLKDPGLYWVEVLDSKGCVGRDTFLLETSYDLLKASFMIPGEATVGDTVAMVDISWPMPERVDWNFPLEMTQVSATDNMVLAQFNAAGTYGVGLTANLGQCLDYVEKNIVIVSGDSEGNEGRLGYEAYVKAFGLYANPNDGSFDVVVDLADTDDIILSIWNAQTGSLVGKVSEKGMASYSVHVDLRPLSSGAYVLRLDHAMGSSYLRFIVR